MDSTTKSAFLARQKSEYVAIMLLVGVGVAGVLWLSLRASASVDPHALIKPMLAMFALTFLVWVLMPLSRHWAVLTQRASVKYFVDFRSEPPAEWVERPARLYNNLMQAPTVFYIISLLMIVTPWADAVQLQLAWIYVMLRAAHALIFLAANHVMLRFASFALSSVVVWVIWGRFAFLAPYN